MLERRLRVRAMVHREDERALTPAFSLPWDGSSYSTTAELIRVQRHKVVDAYWPPAGQAFDAVRHPVIPTSSVQLGHRHEMLVHVLRQPGRFQFPFPKKALLRTRHESRRKF